VAVMIAERNAIGQKGRSSKLRMLEDGNCRLFPSWARPGANRFNGNLACYHRWRDRDHTGSGSADTHISGWCTDRGPSRCVVGIFWTGAKHTIPSSGENERESRSTIGTLVYWYIQIARGAGLEPFGPYTKLHICSIIPVLGVLENVFENWRS